MSMIRPKDGDRVLWICFCAFGDVLESVSCAYAFKKKFPNTRLSFLTRPEYGEILRQQPYIEEVLCWDERPLNFFSLMRNVRGKYQWVISDQSRGAPLAVALFSKAKIKLGYNRGTQFVYTETHWKYLHDLGVDIHDRSEPTIFATEQNLVRARELLAKLPECHRVFAIIGASTVKKCWPTDYWIELIKNLTREGWGVVLNGYGPTEKATAEKILRAVNSDLVLDLVSQADFCLMAAIARSCAAAIGNDTGPLHLAALVGIPTVGFFGMTDAWMMDFKMPWFYEARVTCPDAGCWNYNCPKDCLSDISPARALDIFHKMITSSGGVDKESRELQC